MGWEDGRLAVRYYIGETIAGCSNGNLSEFRCEHPYRAGEKDLISFPIHLTKGVRSEKIDLYNYNYRRMVDVIVTGRTLVKFQNGSTDTVDIGKSLSGKVERQAIFWMTALDGDVDATSIAWN